MVRTLSCMSLLFMLIACGEPGGVSASPQQGFGVAAQALVIPNIIELDAATAHANHGNTATARSGGYAGDDGTGRVSWKQGGFTADNTNEISTCEYGWCGFPSVGSGCLGSESTYGYSFGACNSSAWGQRFAGYLDGVDRPAGSGDMVHSNFAAGASGTTTFGYHPYWAVLYNNECRIYQGWSYVPHSCDGTSYVVNDPSTCGDGSCAYDETCSSCESDCGVCPPPPPAACSFDYQASQTGSASYNNTNTQKFTVELQANVAYTFSTCAIGTGDTFLRLHYNAAEKAMNDDGCGGGVLSQLTYTPAVSGAYELSAGCYNNNSCSGPIQVEPGDETSCAGQCTPQCLRDLCGQDNGCGGVCGSDDISVCGKCGNAACSSCGDGTCDATEDCATCSADCGSCAGNSCDGLVYSTSGTSSAAYNNFNTIQYDMDLVANTTYTISTCGSTSTDTYLRMHLNGAQVAANDDACGYQSSLSFTPAMSGIHVLSLGCYGGTSCAATVSVSPDAICVGR